MERILVTGGAGFIGSHIADALLAEGYKVGVVDDLSTGKRERVPPEAAFYQCDICSPELEAIFADFQPEKIIHAAAQVRVSTSLANPEFDARINILGSLQVLELARRFGCRRIVYSSSAAVYGNPQYLPVDEGHPIHPISPYGISKHTVEHYLYMYQQLYGLDYVVLRYSNVYGPRQDSSGEGGVVAIFIDRLLAGEPPIIYGDGCQTRDFINVKDVARANILALRYGKSRIFNVSSSAETSVNDLLRLIQIEIGCQGKVIHEAERPGEISRSLLSNREVLRAFNWKPEVDLESGLRETVSEVRKTGTKPSKGEA